MKQFMNRFAADESGVTAIEYGLIAALIAIAAIAAMGGVGNSLINKFNQVASALNGTTAAKTN